MTRIRQKQLDAEFNRILNTPIDGRYPVPVDELIKAQVEIRQRCLQDLEFFIRTLYPSYMYCLVGDPWAFHRQLPQMAFSYRNTLNTRQRMGLILEILVAKKGSIQYVEYEPGAQLYALHSLEALLQDLQNPRLIAVFGPMAPACLMTRRGEKVLLTQNGVKVMLRERAQSA
jgi:hypothetical protein